MELKAATGEKNDDLKLAREMCDERRIRRCGGMKV